MKLCFNPYFTDLGKVNVYRNRQFKTFLICDMKSKIKQVMCNFIEIFCNNKKKIIKIDPMGAEIEIEANNLCKLNT